MANIVLTETCVRRCPYCFAKQYMQGIEDNTAISMENIHRIANFMEKSNQKSISLLGGEPLLHPHVFEIISLFLNRGFQVNVFTSGIMANSKLETFAYDIKKLPKDLQKNITFIVNVNEPRFSNAQELEKVYGFLSQLGSFCALSFNIYRLDFNMEFLIEYIIKYGLHRHVRLGLANPIPGAPNEYISPEKFRDIGDSLMSILSKMYDLNIHPGFDCGFPLCMFTDEDLGKLYKYTRNALSFSCGPAVDIGPDLQCWCCFPLSNVHKKSLDDFQSYQDMFNYFSKVQQKYRSEVRGLYLACDTCKFYDELICEGGCVAHIVNRMYIEGKYSE